MSFEKENEVLSEILTHIDLPDSAYEKAEQRYKSIGEHLHEDDSACSIHDPHVFPAGSFRLGTAIRPHGEKEGYDLDIICELQDGITKQTHTQQQLKTLVGNDLERYHKSNNIQNPMEEKKRCWTLEYADDLSFHMDIVPCIPESGTQMSVLRESMVTLSKFDEELADNVAALAVSITDNTDPAYPKISDLWRISNPEGFAKWFGERMQTSRLFLEKRARLVEANIEELPYYRWRTPLQISIQLLKRHRDILFQDNPDSKPISIIITTLAGRAYQGEADVVSAIKRILDEMDHYINSNVPLIPNPVNPAEDFADKWYSSEDTDLKLADNFRMWLQQARADFRNLISADEPSRIVEAADHGLDIKLDKSDIASILGVSLITDAPALNIQTSNPKPWLKRQ